ncbi:MAG: ATP-binding protein [Candidatus Diapherotrites archaeon]|nr:ATP-binding protein [Candidatus Diapherotrites archaeon]
MNEQEVLKRLYEHNPWWKGSRVAIQPYHTRYFHVIKKAELLKSNKKIATIYGPRQVGKTELLKQLVDYLLGQKVKPQNILFVELDDVLLGKHTDDIILDCLEVYSKNILQTSFRESKEEVYIFLDEVQGVEKWSEILKNYHHLNYKIKFFVTGSSSAGIRKGLSESLLGRTEPYLILPLKFSEFIPFKRPKDKERFLSISLSMRSHFGMSLKKKNAKMLYDGLEQYRLSLAGDENTIETLLREYLIKGGYIGVVKETDWNKCTTDLKNYTQLTIYNDIMQAFGIRNPREFDQLLALIAAESSQIMSENGLSKNLSIKIDTLSRYLDLLEDVFLVSSCELYAKSRAKRIRNAKKLYINDIGIRNALLHSLGPHLLGDGAEIGKIVETVVHNHLKRLAFAFTRDTANTCFYGKNNRGKEVDNIFAYGKMAIPIEVKYRETIKSGDEEPVSEFLEETKGKIGIIITKNTLAVNQKTGIVQIPLWMFLFLV